MHRRDLLRSLGAALLAPSVACAALRSATGAAPRRLKRIGVQLYTLRDAARQDVERTLADIAAVGYKEVELLGSMNNFNLPPARLRQVLDRLGLTAPSTHVAPTALDEQLAKNLDDAKTLGHTHITVASFPANRRRTLDDVRRYADKFNEAGAVARRHGIWFAFHNHAEDFTPVEGQIPYDLLVERMDPAVTRQQLDTGNLAMAGRDPIEYMRRYGPRYWSFHIKDVPRIGGRGDTELGKGVIDFKRLLAMVDEPDEKHFYVEQETYPGAPLDSARRDFEYLSTLEF